MKLRNAGRSERNGVGECRRVGAFDPQAPVLEQSDTPPLRSQSAFTLIEFIGVLAVIAVLAAVLAPVLIRRMDQAARVRDAAELAGMADALQSLILRTGQIPSAQNLVSGLANEMAVSSNKVALGVRKVPRVFLSDPNLWIGSTNGVLPYTQSVVPRGTGTNIGGVDMPGRNLRVMIVSSLAVALPTNITFSTAWDTADGAVPAGWTWTGRGDDLKIQRVDLTPLFYRLVLSPIDTNKFGSFAIESGNNVSTTNVIVGYPVGNTTLSNSWYLKSTAVRLYNTNSSPTNYTMESKGVLQRDTSYVFEDLAWRGAYSGRGTNSAAGNISSGSNSWSGAFSGFMGSAQAFTNYPAGPSAPSGSSPTEVLRCFFQLMVSYNFWVQEGFITGSRTAWTALNQAETITSGTMADIIKN